MKRPDAEVTTTAARSCGALVRSAPEAAARRPVGRGRIDGVDMSGLFGAARIRALAAGHGVAVRTSSGLPAPGVDGAVPRIRNQGFEP
jgi:hypothetical protein